MKYLIFRLFVGVFISAFFSMFIGGFIFRSSPAAALSLKDFDRKPKLVVVIVIDQFRADLLTRPSLDFRPQSELKSKTAANKPQKFLLSTAKDEGGFEFLMNRGAYFPFAQYTSLQDMTCPGHATILTGANPGVHGINLNEWFDTERNKSVYCVQDDKDGLSPKRLKSTTVGDEIKAASKISRVYSVSLKDRAAIILGGHNADLALWMDAKTLRWTTSGYYLRGDLPAWVQKQNGVLSTSSPDLNSETVKGATNATRATLALALAAIKAEKLGHGPSVDLLTVSLSSHDILGHKFGPDSGETTAFTFSQDQLLADFFKQLKNEVHSWDDVIIALTADHGTPPSVEVAQAEKFDSGRIDAQSIVSELNSSLDGELGKAAPTEWVVATKSFNFYLNKNLIKTKGLGTARVEKLAKNFLLKQKGVDAVFTRTEYDESKFPPGVLGQQIRNSYLPDQSGDLILIPLPFYYVKSDANVTHMTGWSYDRSVPLILFGRNFKGGVYSGANIVDLAPTLTFLLGVLPPSMNEGRVLSEVIR